MKINLTTRANPSYGKVTNRDGLSFHVEEGTYYTDMGVIDGQKCPPTSDPTHSDWVDHVMLLGKMRDLPDPETGKYLIDYYYADDIRCTCYIGEDQFWASLRPSTEEEIEIYKRIEHENKHKKNK